MKKKWSKLEDLELTELLKSNSRSQVAKIMDRPKNGISCRMHRLGLKSIIKEDSKPIWDKDKISELKKHLAKKIRVKDVADLMGLSYGSVQGAMERNNLKSQYEVKKHFSLGNKFYKKN